LFVIANEKSMLDLKFSSCELKFGCCDLFKFVICCCKNKEIKKGFIKGWKWKLKGRDYKVMLYP